MEISLLNRTTRAGVAAIALGLAGCVTGRPSVGAAAPVVLCPSCETVWVRQRRQVNKTTVYSTGKKMVCPGCASAVETFFRTGKLQHSCTACGGNLEPCKAH